ncbi:hypothetical protein JIQ42_04224 [Leishmania sp. Namibia]|uniref:hypothetical protein n=1 Tax=Leishmania sp. Namibia TaxID=2802991 RepID=UPI001B4B0B8F|nr:hypothetical protein JIQ42_04224 [Leishmania sp. Namibia]
MPDAAVHRPRRCPPRAGTRCVSHGSSGRRSCRFLCRLRRFVFLSRRPARRKTFLPEPPKGGGDGEV